MKFKFKSYDVDLIIEDYEFKNIKNLEEDANWLVVNVTYENSDIKIIKKDSALLISELIELREWFFDIYNKKTVNSLNFVENAMEFICCNNTIIVELCFNLSLYDTKSLDDECCVATLHLNEKYLYKIVNELDKYINKFPIRK